MSERGVTMEVIVLIQVNDEQAITRCTENHNADGVPQPDVKGGLGWRNRLYDLRSEADVLGHWAYNAVMNGVRDANSLDGWADLPRDAVTMDVTHAWMADHR